ncbi:MAG: S-adenosylmethionine:tRNA ribosyltransferase-isomerase, partial [Clostridia bacterium]|nr:S-adenosylmethionine:tRNA ribosyltransferase-isomerase [Clostridia bacterium]
AFYNREQMMEAYHTAVEEGYRFFSFGDALFIQEAAQYGVAPRKRLDVGNYACALLSAVRLVLLAS